MQSLSLQDGRLTDASSDRSTKGLSREDGYEGCLSASAHSQGSREVFANVSKRRDISIQSTSNWTQSCFSDIDKSSEGSVTTTQREVDENDCITGQHL